MKKKKSDKSAKTKKSAKKKPTKAPQPAKKSKAIMKRPKTFSEVSPDVMHKLIIKGDLSQLSSEQKVAYYKALCERLGLDHVTKPFEIISMKGKEVVYATRACAAQLNKLYRVTHKILTRETTSNGEYYIVTARASLVSEKYRYTESIGAVYIKGLSGEAFCNAMMKAETKAKRRSTLDLLGLGILDETEINDIKDDKPKFKEPKRASESKPKADKVVDAEVVEPQQSAKPQPESAVTEIEDIQDIEPTGERQIMKCKIKKFAQRKNKNGKTVYKALTDKNLVLYTFHMGQAHTFEDALANNVELTLAIIECNKVNYIAHIY